MKILLLFLAMAMVLPMSAQADDGDDPKALAFEMKTLEGKPAKLADYQGKVLLVVNVASQCGLTPQYEGLQALHEAHEKDGLVVMGFPCNQFGAQEPGTPKEIREFCSTNYNVSFPLFSKIDVNGDGACPLYKHLTSLDLSPVGSGKISWNFEKFLINRKGEVIARFSPPPALTTPSWSPRSKKHWPPSSRLTTGRTAPAGLVPAGRCSSPARAPHPFPPPLGFVPARRCSPPARAPHPFPPPLGSSQRGAAPRQPVRRTHSRHRWGSSQRGTAPRQPVGRTHSRSRWACPSGALLLASPCAAPIPATAGLVPAGRCSSPARAAPIPATAGLVPAGRCSSPDSAVRRPRRDRCWRGATLDRDLPPSWRACRFSTCGGRKMEPLQRLLCGKKLQVASLKGLAYGPGSRRDIGRGIASFGATTRLVPAECCFWPAPRQAPRSAAWPE